MAGIRAELVFPDADRCPVAEASTEVDGSITEVSWAENGDGAVVEQFSAAGSVDLGEQVFDYGPQTVHEFERDGDDPCICEEIEGAVGPITETYARDGDLHVTLHAVDMDALRDIVSTLEENFGSVRIEYLVRGREETEEAELIPVDMRKLTERQREVLQTATGWAISTIHGVRTRAKSPRNSVSARRRSPSISTLHSRNFSRSCFCGPEFGSGVASAVCRPQEFDG